MTRKSSQVWAETRRSDKTNASVTGSAPAIGRIGYDSLVSLDKLSSHIIWFQNNSETDIPFYLQYSKFQSATCRDCVFSIEYSPSCCQ